MIPPELDAQMTPAVRVFVQALLGQPCSAALTVKMQTAVTAAARPAYEELVAKLPTEAQINADETATKEENGKA